MKSRLKKRLIACAAILAVLGLLGYAVYYVVFSNRKTIELAPDAIVAVDWGDLTSVYTASATVESGQQGVFEILDGTKVKTVSVRVGDAVKKGDLLASFDPGSLDEMLRAKKRDYDAASKSYRDYIKNVNSAPKQSAALKKQIAELEKKIADLQKAEPAPEDKAPAASAEKKQLDELKKLVAGLLGNTRTANWVVDRVFTENGSVTQTVSAFQNLLGSTFTGGMDYSSMMESMMGGGGMGSLMNSDLLNASLQLIQLKAQEAMVGLQSGVSLDSVYKSLADSAESAYRQAEQITSLLKKGWVAEYDGVVREVNVDEGEVYRSPGSGGSPAASSVNVTNLLAALTTGNTDIGSMLGGLFSNTVSGMVVEYYPFTASFVLGKYDIAKVSLDQKVSVQSVSGKQFDAIVSYISPVAAENSGINISSIMGASGSSKGVEARVTIPEPDLSITIGLDVDVTIELDTKQNVLRVPVSAMKIDDETGGYFVYQLERASRTVKKVPVKTGMFDNSGTTAYYEILDGLEEGMEIVRAPASAMKDGAKVKLL